MESVVLTTITGNPCLHLSTNLSHPAFSPPHWGLSKQQGGCLAVRQGNPPEQLFSWELLTGLLLKSSQTSALIFISKECAANESEDNFKHCLYIYSSQHLLSLSKSAHQDQSPIATKIIILIGRGFLLACSMFFCLFVFFSKGILVWSSNFH